MPYVNTLQSGAVSGTFVCQQTPGQVFLQDTDPLVAAFNATLPVIDGGASALARLVALEGNMKLVLAVPVIATAIPVPVAAAPSLSVGA